MKRLLLLLIFMFALIGTTYATLLDYRESTKGTVNNTVTEITKLDQGYVITATGKMGLLQAFTAKDFNAYALDWHQNDDNFLKVTTGSSVMIFAGKYKGVQVNKKVAIEDLPWYPNLYLLKGFVMSEKTSHLFIMTMLNDQSIMTLKAIREKRETVSVNGMDIDSIKIRVTIPDWRSAFWNSYYWFRASDGVLVKSKETRGPPGTPETILELIKEEPRSAL